MGPLARIDPLVRRLQIHWIDLALAVGLSLGAVLEGSARDSLSFSPGVFLCTVPLVVRRRWPIPVLVAAVVGFSVAGGATGIMALIGGLIGALSIGLYTRNQLLAWLSVLGASLLIALEFGNGNSNSTLPIPSAVLPFLLIGAAHLAGREIAARQKALNLQRQRTEQLERKQEGAIKAAAESERRHIARELHDVVAHSVSVMVVQAGAARKVLTDKPEAARQSLLSVEASGHEAMAELRRLLGVLSENGGAAPLAPQPGLQNVEALVTNVNDAGLPVVLRIEGEPFALQPGVDMATYRIVQEALTNALKYAGGARTEVTVRYTPEAIDLEVTDEGAIATPADSIGRGLIGMRERVAVFGGTIEAGKRPGGGYMVRAHLPIEKIS